MDKMVTNIITSNDTTQNVRRWSFPEMNNPELGRTAVKSTESKSGYKEGYAEGFKKGSEDADQSFQAIKSQFIALMNGLTNPSNELMNQIEEELLELVICLSKSVIKKEVSQDSSELLNIIKDAKKIVPSHEMKVSVYLNPLDVDLIKQKFSSDSSVATWNLIADEGMLQGGCRISTSSVQIDGSIESRLSAVMAQLFD